MSKRKYIYPLLLLFAISFAYGNEASITSNLKNLGFEDILVKDSGNVLYIAMQNKAYRGTFRGWSDAIKMIRGTEDAPDSIIIIALENKIPMLCIRTSKKPNPVNVDYATSGSIRKLEDADRTACSFGKTDIIVYPEISLDNHRFDILFETVINLSPTIKVDLWKGALFTGQMIIPIWNNISGEVDKVRPGFVTLSQTEKLTDRLYATLSGGLFSENRYGIHGFLRYSLDKRITLSGDIGYTGYSSFYNGWSHQKMDRTDAALTISYFEPRTALQINGSIHRYVYGHYGAKMEIVRHFSDYTVGFYGILVEGGHNAGFNFSIPIQGGKKYPRRNIRVKLPDYFDWEYNMVSNHKGWNENHLKTYETIPDENNSDHYWQAEYVKGNINRELNK
jgi:hypothetical protein